MFKLASILFSMTVLSLTSCKSINNTDLKDDVLVKSGESSKLYWVVGDGESQQVCRASCDASTIKVEGNLEDTRNSCDRGSAESINAKLFQDNKELQGLYAIFFKNVSQKKVAVLTADSNTQNKKRVQLIDSLFNDENMYLDPATRELRQQGLTDYSNQEIVRFDPRCYTAKVEGSQVVVNQNSSPASAPAASQAVVFNTARSVEVNELIYYGVITFLKSRISPYESIYKVWGTQSQGSSLVWFSKNDQQPYTKVSLGSDRGPALYDEKETLSRYLSIENAEAGGMWADFLSAIAKISQRTLGTDMKVSFQDGVGYKVQVSQTSGNFSSPGVPQYHNFYLRPFMYSSQSKFYFQFDSIEASK